MSTAIMTAIYDKRDSNFTILKDDVFKNDLSGNIGFWPEHITKNNLLFDYIDAYDILKQIIPSNLRNKITDTSNPVLMIVK